MSPITIYTNKNSTTFAVAKKDEDRFNENSDVKVKKLSNEKFSALIAPVTKEADRKVSLVQLTETQAGRQRSDSTSSVVSDSSDLSLDNVDAPAPADPKRTAKRVQKVALVAIFAAVMAAIGFGAAMAFGFHPSATQALLGFGIPVAVGGLGFAAAATAYCATHEKEQPAPKLPEITL